MTIAAHSTTPTGFYRLTQPVFPNTYYTRASDAQVRQLVRRLGKRDPSKLTTADLRALHDAEAALSGKLVLMAHRTRFKGCDGKRHESVSYVGVRPDYEFREVQKPPGYGPTATNGAP